MLKPLTRIASFPLGGGCVTAQDKTTLPFGTFSMVQNLRTVHSGSVSGKGLKMMRKRGGCRTLHTTADSTNRALSLYQFRKTMISENHFFAQFDDNDVLVASSDAPAVSGSTFGSEIFSGSASSIPAAWSAIRDIMIFSNGVDQHQCYAGDDNYVEALIKYDGSVAPGDVPELGFDYSREVTDGLLSTYANLDDGGVTPSGLDTLANFECLFICTPVPVTKLTLTFVSGQVNASAATGTLSYRKSDGTWVDTSETDGTISSSATFGQDGSLTWSQPSDEVPYYMFGRSGYWYRWETSAQLDDDVQIYKATYGHNSEFLPIENVWDGALTSAVEVLVEGTSQFETYPYNSVDLDALASGKKIRVAATDPITGIYIDPGGTPNATGTSLTSLKYWDGSAWTSVGTTTDGTSGMSNAGWITFPRQAAQPLQLEGSQYYAYWYELIWNSALAADTVVEIYVLPYFDITDFGNYGYCTSAWKNRMCYTFDLWGKDIYVSAQGQPLMLNGNDYGILQPGDGRANRTVNIHQFKSEILVFQEEKGVEGGCITLFQGYKPGTWGKLLLSSWIGTMNNQSVVMVEGVLTSTATEERIRDLCFFLSRHGVCVTDGNTISIVSDDIQNYFDHREQECIRRGYEDKMWIGHDSAENVLRLGLVSGTPRSTGTTTSTTADKLVNSAGAFTTDGTEIEDTVSNVTDGTTALVTAIDSATTLSLDTDIMTSGESYEILAGNCNVFSVFDLVNKEWSFDDPAQPLSCFREIESSGSYVINSKTYDPPILQVGGGTQDGFVYQLNYGDNDVSTAIDGYFILELNYRGEYLQLVKMLLRCIAQSAGNITVTFTKNDIAAGTKTLSMTVEVTGQKIRRHLFPINIQDQNISIKVQHNTTSQNMKLVDMGLETFLYDRR